MFSARQRGLLLILPIVLLATSAAQAQNWAEQMFDSLSHDFGTVAKDAEVVHRFRVTNRNLQDIQIASVTASCICAVPKFNNAPVKPGESTDIVISIDTHKVSGERSPTVTVTFNQPQFATVRIPIKVYIRSDLSLTPGSVNFGGVEQGTKQDRKIAIAYVGRPDWKILKVTTNNKYLSAKAVESSRNGTNVNYDLAVTLLPNAPIGPLHEQLMLETDDANAPQLPVLVRARVEADVVVSPSIVQLGAVTPGTESVKTVLIRGHKPFVIDRIECESGRGAFQMSKLLKEPKTAHVVSLTFTAPKEQGPIAEKFIVTVAGRREPITFTARGTIDSTQR